ncbi:MAG: hypothetical protein COT55_01925, partial [Candidatus Diapherotrites archaeon CG09_land_8_20_14_0_10_32_12]
MKKLLLLLFCLIFIAGIGFSKDIDISENINTPYTLLSGNNYTVINDINVSENGFFILPSGSSTVTFQCRDSTIFVNDET